MHVADTESFARGEMAASFAQLAGGQVAAEGMRGHAANEMRRRVEAWARGRGLALVESELTDDIDGVLVRVRPSKRTGDEAFDRAWRTQSADEALVPNVIDAAVREALRGVLGWCRATYDDGRIEISLDAPNMCGARLLEGIAVAAALGQTRYTPHAYR